MMYHQKIACVFGGTGFIGRQIVRELAARGYQIKVPTRIPESGYFLKPSGAIGQIVPIQCDVHSAESVARVIKGSDVVINCIGILFEKGKRGRFHKIHTEVPALIARVAHDENVSHLVHISALGCDKGLSKYAQSKKKGEEAVLANYPQAVILRPSVVFGVDDDFFNKFAELARYVPFLPLIGGGKTKFQPVYVGDIADATTITLSNHNFDGKVIELGGPEILDFKQLMEYLFHYTGRSKKLIKIPFGVAKIQAFFMALLPNPVLTPDQVASLKTDSIVTDDNLTFNDLGIQPKSLELILPTYLERYRAGGRFSKELQGQKA